MTTGCSLLALVALAPRQNVDEGCLACSEGPSAEGRLTYVQCEVKTEQHWVSLHITMPHWQQAQDISLHPSETRNAVGTEA